MTEDTTTTLNGHIDSTRHTNGTRYRSLASPGMASRPRANLPEPEGRTNWLRTGAHRGRGREGREGGRERGGLEGFKRFVLCVGV